MLAVAMLPALLFGLLALMPTLDTSSDDVIEDDVDIEDPDIEDPDGEGGDDEDPDGEDPADEDPEEVEPTVVSITGEDGETRDVEVTQGADGEPTTVDGSDERDIIESPDDPTVLVQVNGLGGDDAIEFGYSTSVDGGEGDDTLALNITQAALDNGDLEAGVVTFDDVADVLAIAIDDGAEGFLHEVRVNSSDTVDDTTTTQTVTLFYVLGQSDTLTIDAAASAAAGEIVFEDGAQVLVQIDLGTETTTTGTDDDGEPTEDVTGGINDDPTIAINRDVTSEQTFDLPEAEDDEDEEGGDENDNAPLATITTDGGETTPAELDDTQDGEPARLTATDGDDTVIVDSAASDEFIVSLEDGDDAATIGLFQDIDAAQISTRADPVDDGTDAITVDVRPEVFDAINATNGAATNDDEFVYGPTLALGPSDTLTFEIDASIQGQLVQINGTESSLPGPANNSDQNDFNVSFYLVPDDVDLADVEAAFTNPEFDSDLLITQFGAVGLGTAFLGSVGQIGDGPDVFETWDTQFELASIEANRAITVIDEPSVG